MKSSVIFRFILLLTAVTNASFKPACFGQMGTFLDQGGAVFNVKAYGATGGGSSSDTTPINNAISAALSAGGGVVYFPAGTYRLDSAIVVNRSDLVSLIGSGVGTVLKEYGGLGISLASTAPYVAASGYHSGTIQGMKINCGSISDTGIEMRDMVSAPQFSDVVISNCANGIHVINQQLWNERLNVRNLTDDYNTHLFFYDQNPTNPNNSFGYGTYQSIYINKRAGQDVFYLTGGGYLYHSTFVIKGNFDSGAQGASIFNLQGNSGQPCPGAAFNFYDIGVEGNSYAVVNTSNNGCSGGPAGNTLVSGIGIINATNAVPGSTNLIADLSKSSFLAATFTASAATSDSVPASTANPSTPCYVQPTNAVAASHISGTFVSGTNWSTVYVTHPAGAAGGTFQVWCHP